MKYITAGESHGQALCVIVDGMPAGVTVTQEAINKQLARRQGGYGRGARQKIETDKAEILSGLRFSKTLATPITLYIKNSDHKNWKERMSVFGEAPAHMKRETHPRPGHADLVGMLKYDTDDARNILERSSARETAARVAAGAIARCLLEALGVTVNSYVCRIGSAFLADGAPVDLNAAKTSPCFCPDEATTQAMMAEIDKAKEAGVSLGGQFVVTVSGLVPGLGTYATGSERLTSRLGAAIFSIPAIKGVEFGMGFEASCRPGSQVHDPISYRADSGFGRLSNNAGGLEGGMSTGEPLVIRAAMKPIPTMRSALQTVDTDTHETVLASTERSDTVAVPAASVVAEAEVAFCLADAYTKMFGCTTLHDLINARDAYLRRIARR